MCGGKQAEENVGMSMVFTLCEGIKDWLLENNEEVQDDSMHAQMMRRQQQKEKEKLSAANTLAAQEISKNSTVSACAGWLQRFMLLFVHVVVTVIKLRQELKDDEKRREGTLVTPEAFAAWKVGVSSIFMLYFAAAVD